jgi:dihydroorotate dehydrogenase electron transfer subunit
LQLEDGIVIEHQDIRGGYTLLVMRAPRIAAATRPGQFVHVRVPHLGEALLRRPFSIFRAEADRVSILYKGVGRGTRTLQYLRPGEAVSLLGPLGHGFPGLQPGRFPLLVAGGYGMAALYLSARDLPVKGAAFFGGRRDADILCVPEFEALGWDVRVATEDGSLGRKGLVTDALDAWWAENPGAAPEVYACGPNAMLKAVALRAHDRGWPAWVSVDEKMGCGVGACLTCVVRVRDEDDGWAWERSCREGPVFDSRRILWDEIA